MSMTPELRAALEALTKRYPEPAMGLVEALREVQRRQGRVAPEAEAELAALFGLPAARVHEVATFFPYFTAEHAGRHRLCVCRNLSCQRRGAGDLVGHLHRALGPEGQTTPDGLLSWEAVECLGACDHAPAVALDDELLGAGTPAFLDALVADLKAGKRPKPVEPRLYAPPADGAPRVLTTHFSEPSLHRLETYRRFGGYAALEKAKGMEPSALLAEVKSANLRGLGGAGFPAGMKWETVPPKSQRQAPHYLIANADESEPGCYKDRVLMERDPHGLLEGLCIAARALDADGVFIFLRGEYAFQKRVLETAIAEARAAGATDREILVVSGANAYISGCDTALIETLEGKKAQPRQPPPFPTVAGLLGCPTVVNNVETLMMLRAIVRDGGAAFAKLGVPRSGGTNVYSVSGDVERPGVYEFPMGTPMSVLLAACGGVRGGRRLKAVIPGGTSTPVLTAAEAAAVKLDFDALRTAGSFLGAGGVVVLDETADMVEVLHVIERFLWHESCGQCTPCREGSGWVERILRRILGGGGVPEDKANLVRIGENVTGRVICALGDTVGMVAKAMIEKFPEDFDRRLGRSSAGAASQPLTPAPSPGGAGEGR
ncbi:MAG: NADH-quinone oxidoreductase subunit NuoF [Elusimicrobiota bacterium]|jgi:NADH:ubiquinone oxidoreductase subunit F (NADH-binding)/NADH:ubiquinone oxidoreductase subunit E